jgi:hypothetical protein
MMPAISVGSLVRNQVHNLGETIVTSQVRYLESTMESRSPPPAGAPWGKSLHG